MRGICLGLASGTTTLQGLVCAGCARRCPRPRPRPRPGNPPNTCRRPLLWGDGSARGRGVRGPACGRGYGAEAGPPRGQVPLCFSVEDRPRPARLAVDVLPTASQQRCTTEIPRPWPLHWPEPPEGSALLTPRLFIYRFQRDRIEAAVLCPQRVATFTCAGRWGRRALGSRKSSSCSAPTGPVLCTCLIPSSAGASGPRKAAGLGDWGHTSNPQAQAHRTGLCTLS